MVKGKFGFWHDLLSLLKETKVIFIQDIVYLKNDYNLANTSSKLWSQFVKKMISEYFGQSLSIFSNPTIIHE